MAVTAVPAILTPTELTFLDDHGALVVKQAAPDVSVECWP